MIFITFGSHGGYIDAAVRLTNQANTFQLFTNNIAYTGKYLQLDKPFWKQHGHFIKNNKRGFGYWIWKPYLILKTINQMKDGDILLYLDCGCELDFSEKKYLIEYIEIVKQDKLMACYTTHIEKLWNKQDLINNLDMNQEHYLITPQREAGAILLLVCDETRKLVEEWYATACNYSMIDDTPSIQPNYIEFKEHRHDQSIFSLLTKKYNLCSDISINTYCIKYLRNRSGYTLLKPKYWYLTTPYIILVFTATILWIHSMWHLLHNRYDAP